MHKSSGLFPLFARVAQPQRMWPDEGADSYGCHAPCPVPNSSPTPGPEVETSCNTGCHFHPLLIAQSSSATPHHPQTHLTCQTNTHTRTHSHITNTCTKYNHYM